MDFKNVIISEYAKIFSYTFNVQSLLSKMTLKNFDRMVTKIEDVGKRDNNGLPCYLFDHRNFGLDDDLDLHLIKFARKDEQLRKLLFEEGWKWNFGADEVKWIYLKFVLQGGIVKTR